MIQTKTLQQFINDLVSGWAGNTGVPANLPSGDPLLAEFQSVASQLISLQSLFAQAYIFARAATATGADLDSWMADFGVTRIPAAAATGSVTFTTNTIHGSPTNIPIGSLVQIQGGAVQYAVIAPLGATDPNNGNYSGGNLVLPTGVGSVSGTVQCTTAGTIGNATANQINQLGGAIPGIDTCNNTLSFSPALAPFTAGSDAESDAQLRLRFINTINSLAKATQKAILAAIGTVPAANRTSLLENFGPGYAPPGLFGAFLVIASDATAGTLTAADQLSLFTAVDAVRAFTIMPSVEAPSAVSHTVALNIRILAGTPFTNTQIQNQVQTNIVSYINALPIGATLYLNKLNELAIDTTLTTTAGVVYSPVLSTQPGATLIDGSALDVTPVFWQLATAGTVTIGTY